MGGGDFDELHNTILCKYFEKVIVAILHYPNNDDITSRNFWFCNCCLH
jgi:hypothetical protein